MANELLDKGVKHVQPEYIEQDPHIGFMQSVRNSQPRLAMNYLVDIINGLDARIQELEARLGVEETVVEEEPVKKVPAKKTTAAKAKAADADES